MWVHSAGAQDAPKWKIAIVFVDKQHEHDDQVAGWYANDDVTAVRLFDDEKSCKDFLAHDKKVAERKKKANEIALKQFDGRVEVSSGSAGRTHTRTRSNGTRMPPGSA